MVVYAAADEAAIATGAVDGRSSGGKHGDCAFASDDAEVASVEGEDGTAVAFQIGRASCRERV